MAIQSTTDLSQFSSVATTPSHDYNNGPAGSGIGTGLPNNLVTGVLQFPDGVRSSAANRRLNWSLPAAWPKNGWRPILTQSGNFGTWSPYLPAGHANQTAANFDRLMSQGWIMFYLGGNLGNNGQAQGKPWPGGWWAHSPAGVKADDVANFQLGTSKLAGQSVAASNAVMGQQGQSPLPMPQAMPMQQIPIAPPRFWTLPKLLIAGAVVGGLYYALE